MVILRVVLVVQARLGSTRLPGKVLAALKSDLSILQAIFHRASRAKLLDQVVFAIPDGHNDDFLAESIRFWGGEVFRGSASDVRRRFLDCCLEYDAEVCVRVTGDCPLIDPELIDAVVRILLESDCDYVSNIDPPTFPDGLDVEAFKVEALQQSEKDFPGPFYEEHVTPALREGSQFKRANLSSKIDYSHLRWTVDYQEDLDWLNRSLPSQYLEMNFRQLIETPGIGNREAKFIRNEGSTMPTGQKYWTRAKELIPGGSMLFSKRPDLYHPALWPAYYSKAKGIEIWDLDGRKFSDFTTMSVGACSLGYADPQVNEAVIEAIQLGNMTTLNASEEIDLADRLTSLHPWAQMVRFARSGGEANAIAVRIARSQTRRDKVAICGYHGWHDWYLAANLSSTNTLGELLMPGLPPNGVPAGLKGSVSTFPYNDLSQLEDLLKTETFAAVKMEVSRSQPPKTGFLEGVRALCNRYGTLLIFDECTSGFRAEFGGYHLRFGVNPDMAMYGKAIANGFALTAVIGTKEAMAGANQTFISSTFWTERIGSVAALATLDKMQLTKSWATISQIGLNIKEFWAQELSRLGANFSIFGLDALPGFTLEIDEFVKFRTVFTQEMLARDMLATNIMYPSILHDGEPVDAYKSAFSEVIEQVFEWSIEGKLDSKLVGPPATQGFGRLN